MVRLHVCYIVLHVLHVCYIVLHVCYIEVTGRK